ncbi:hypothetical protein Bhyg_17125 [Pseudolycoriella hygida]|uniref:F-box domain-containing protein n=1 Tax=Pseudolycoriella hygida TaxID=35572 RepID=A0A9Q0MKV6_9DIPT|nr:hypothetical protein Bhyg_17125 [Pseudolycoriella hygida]
MSDKERVSEMESPIEILSEDALLHIFSYLDGKSLKNSALVCKNWNNVISESSAIMKNFTLTLDDESKWISRFHEIMSLTRRFQSINITLHSSKQPYYLEKWTENAINLLMRVAVRHGSYIRKLVLTNAEIKNSCDFSSILSSMPLLNEVVLNRVKVDEVDDFTGGNEGFLSKFNKLTISTCNWDIFKFFISTPIRELQVSNRFASVDIQQREYYMPFLESSQRLESIELNLMSYAKTFSISLDGAICLKLKRLKCTSPSPTYDSNFGTFLETQASTLTELELSYVHPAIINIIFTKLKVLEKLKIDSVMLPSEISLYASFKEMPNMKELILRGDIPRELAVKKILANCANLETFSACHDSFRYFGNLLNFMAANNPALKSLSLDSLPNIISREVKFCHLKFLHVETCENFENLLQFLDSNPTVETLSLNLNIPGVILDHATLEALQRHPNLQNLEVGEDETGLIGISNTTRNDM